MLRVVDAEESDRPERHSGQRKAPFKPSCFCQAEQSLSVHNSMSRCSHQSTGCRLGLALEAVQSGGSTQESLKEHCDRQFIFDKKRKSPQLSLERCHLLTERPQVCSGLPHSMQTNHMLGNPGHCVPEVMQCQGWCHGLRPALKVVVVTRVVSVWLVYSDW